MIKLVNLASGSKGNATLVFDDEGLFLVDMGVPKYVLTEGLAKLGKTIGDIDAVFFTHEHRDHIGGVKYLPETLPMYAGSKTVRFPHIAMRANSFIEIKGFKITSLRTSHDAPMSRCYLFRKGDETLGYMTDTGEIPRKTLMDFTNLDYYVIESNHDVEMLLASNRPQILKERILSIKGHLSNNQCGNYLTTMIGDKTKKVMLAHLSEECNTEELALNTVISILEDAGLDISNIEIKCARQREAVEL